MAKQTEVVPERTLVPLSAEELRRISGWAKDGLKRHTGLTDKQRKAEEELIERLSSALNGGPNEGR